MIAEITHQHRQQLDESGYFVLESVFTPDEMNEVAARVEVLEQRHADELRASGGNAGISRADEITFTAFLAEADESIRNFCRRPEFVAISTALLGPDIDLYWNQSVFKKPEGEREFPWHQDEGYAPTEPSPYLTLWLALNDATLENGCVSVLPGSHQRGRVPHVESPLGQICYDNAAPDQGVRVPVKAGSIVVFTSLTFHRSGPNLSDGTRKAYVIQYSHAGLRHAQSGEAFANRIAIARAGQPVAA